MQRAAINPGAGAKVAVLDAIVVAREQLKLI